MGWDNSIVDRMLVLHSLTEVQSLETHNISQTLLEVLNAGLGEHHP